MIIAIVAAFDLSTIYTNDLDKFGAFVVTLFVNGIPLLTFT